MMLDSASSAPARSIDETARSISVVWVTSSIGIRWTSTSNIERSISSGLRPWLIVRLPCGSRSTASTRRPRSLNATARFSVVVVLATPPFWFANAMTFADVTGVADGAALRGRGSRRIAAMGAGFGSCSHSPLRALARVNDEPAALESVWRAVEAAPRLGHVEASAAEQAREIREAVDAHRVAPLGAAAPRVDERPHDDAAAGQLVVRAVLEHEPAVVELLPVARAEPARQDVRAHDLDQERAVRAQRPLDLDEDALVVGLVGEVPERGEEVEHRVELGLPRQLAHVAADELELDAGRRRRVARRGDRRVAEVES